MVNDTDLRNWMETEGEAVRELIVEVKLPRRKVSVVPGVPGEAAVVKVKSAAGTKREKVLAELASFAAEMLDEPPNALKAAGALALRATAKQARALAQHRLVKAIRPNRHLK